LRQAAQQLRASIHLPRIGAGTPDFNWYATEKYIRSLIVRQGSPFVVLRSQNKVIMWKKTGVDAFVYYYSRNQKYYQPPLGGKKLESDVVSEHKGKEKEEEENDDSLLEDDDDILPDKSHRSDGGDEVCLVLEPNLNDRCDNF